MVIAQLWYSFDYDLIYIKTNQLSHIYTFFSQKIMQHFQIYNYLNFLLLQWFQFIFFMIIYNEIGMIYLYIKHVSKLCYFWYKIIPSNAKTCFPFNNFGFKFQTSVLHTILYTKSYLSYKPPKRLYLSTIRTTLKPSVNVNKFWKLESLQLLVTFLYHTKLIFWVTFSVATITNQLTYIENCGLI